MMDKEDQLLLTAGTIEQIRKYIKNTVKQELKKQTDSWNEFVKTAILTIFYLSDVKTTFFTRRNELRKRTNLSLDERIYLVAPSNIELRMPVAIKKTENENRIILYDVFGRQKVTIEEKPEYELREDIIYIAKQIRHYPMYPYEPILDKNRNGMEFYLKPTALTLEEEPVEDPDFDILREVPDTIETEEEAINIITTLQNHYRLQDYYVERNNEVTITVEGKENFIITYSEVHKTLKIAIVIAA